MLMHPHWVLRAERLLLDVLIQSMAIVIGGQNQTAKKSVRITITNVTVKVLLRVTRAVGD